NNPVISGASAQQLTDCASESVLGNPIFTHIECDYSHPNLVEGVQSHIPSPQTVNLTPPLSFLGAKYEFSYDAHLAERVPVAGGLPRFRAHDSLGRRSQWTLTTPGGNGYLMSFRSVTAIRIREAEGA